MEVIVDTRERLVHSAIQRISTAVYPNIKVTIKEIQVGDYAVLYNGHLLALFERKTWADLCSTFTDPSRKHNYKKMLQSRETSSHLRVVAYILEGRVGKDPRSRVGGKHGVNVGRLKSHVDHLSIREGIMQFHTKDVEGTARKVLEMAHAFSTCKELLSEIKVGGDAEEELSRRREKTPEQVTAMMWASLRISPKISDMLREHYSLQNILLDPPDPETLASLKYPSGVSLGKVRSAKVHDALANPSYEKLLSSIPWISEPISRVIAETVELQDLLQNKVPKNKIAELRRKNGKRLGTKIEERVFSAFQST